MCACVRAPSLMCVCVRAAPSTNCCFFALLLIEIEFQLELQYAEGRIGEEGANKKKCSKR